MGIKRRSSVAPSRPAPAAHRPAPSPAPAARPAAPAPVHQPAAQHHTQAPAHHAPQQPMMQQQQPMMQQQPMGGMMQQQPQQSGGLMSSIAGGIMNGMTFGVGSAVANRAVDAVMGPRTVQHEYVNSPPAAAPAAAPAQTYAPAPQSYDNTMLSHCVPHNTNYNQCMAANPSNPAACNDFMTAFQQCQSGRQ